MQDIIPQYGVFYAEYDESVIVGPFPAIAAIAAHTKALNEYNTEQAEPEVHPGESRLLYEALNFNGYPLMTPEEDLAVARKYWKNED